MTTSKSANHDVVVVDGSNIATEGRSTPSLAQLNDAVMAFRDEFPDATVTVVVDATFGHRIDKAEVADFDAAVAHNELVAPPAGAIGRGDAFVLNIANKVGARILSNDSFQEFHGTYPWLFDDGRLIGGKPVPHIGWVFVERLPVKGPTSRKAQRAAREPRPSRRAASKAASQPMPVPTAPPPGPRRGAAVGGGDGAKADVAATAPVTAVVSAAAAVAAQGPTVNDLLPFLEFVEHHPIGSSVNGVVESYSSHGAYVQIGEVRGYVPLRLMADPPPRSAREVMRVDDAVTLVVASFSPSRRSIDLAVPPMGPEVDVVAEAPPPVKAPARRSRAKKAVDVVAAVEAAIAEEVTPAPPAAAPAKRSRARRPAVVEEAVAGKADEAAVEEARPPSRRSRAKKAATPAKKEAAPVAEEAKAPAKRSRAKKTAAPAEAPAAAEVAKAPAKRSRAKKAAAAPAEEPAPAKRTTRTSKTGRAARKKAAD